MATAEPDLESGTDLEFELRANHSNPHETTSHAFVSSQGPRIPQRRQSQDARRSVDDSVYASESALGSNSDVDEGDEMGLFSLAEEMHSKTPPTEPWFLEMSRLRRMYILWLNKRLASSRRDILESKRASDSDMEELGKILHLQAEAIRDLQTMRELDCLSAGEMEQLDHRTVHHLRNTAVSQMPGVVPFQADNYRRLRAPKEGPLFDGVREYIRSHAPERVTWTEKEKQARREYYDIGTYKPETLSASADRLARFIVAMFGALFILVPMYVMALHQNPTKNLIATIVAVMLFAVVCSMLLRLANDQVFSATVGYAAVLMVFVGLTSAPDK